MAADKGAKRPIIVKKVRKGGHAHHGGSWKVAYADFVTAMMAFFMVMWILGMDEQTRKAIEGYFANPAGFKKGYGSGSTPLSNGNSPAAMRDNQQVRMMVHRAEERAMRQTAERIRIRLDSARKQLGAAHYELAVGDNGLRIELIEAGDGETLFPRGSAGMTGAARLALEIIGVELNALRSDVVVEGHTDAATYGRGGNYTNWELSADRANAARRVLESAGVQAHRVKEIRGYADTRLRNADDPYARENRRISVLLQFTQPEPEKSTTVQIMN
ncbi:MAG: OmpA family protein [Gemmatimonadetes bacterium]|nr:OmpA family protein [Gemmatimonadota bacterium]